VTKAQLGVLAWRLKSERWSEVAGGSEARAAMISVRVKRRPELPNSTNSGASR